MIQEITLSGGRQTGKSYKAMKLAIEAAMTGERVMYDCDSRNMLKVRFADLQQLVSADEVDRIVRSNGEERIDFRSGGSIVMLNRAAHGGRGFTADMHVIDHDKPGAEANYPALLGSPNPRVIRTVLATVGAEC